MRHAAVKLIFAESEHIDRQLRELVTATTLHHPYLITCFHAGSAVLPAGKLLYLVMEVAAESLQSRLDRGVLTIPEARLVTAQLADALAYLHQQRRVHRDVKPANVLLCGGVWKLADFGAVRQSGLATTSHTGFVVGTLRYMPPESFDGVVSPAWDVWSLGILLSQALAGQVPFDESSEQQLMWAISSQEPRIPPNLPAPFDEVVRGCLVRDHRARWSAARVLDAIRASQPGAFSSVASTKRHTVIESLPVPPRQKTAPAAPRPAGPPPAAPTPRKAWPWLFAVLAVCTVAAAVVWVWHPWRSATSAGGAGSQQPSYPKPRIDTLTVEPANIYKGQTATMRWSTSDTTVVSFDPSIGQVQSSGFLRISPDHTTQYTLTATGPGGTKTRSVRLDVSTPAVFGPPSPGTPKVNLKDSQTYVWIPPGSFAMGCSEEDADCFPIEKPSHEVTIAKGFWMGNTEVTQEAFEHVMGTNPSYFKGAQLPVEQVAWFEAEDYCGRVGLRLPTEAEWEYGARAGSTGSRYGDLSGVAWFFGHSGSKTHEVGRKLRNNWGLYDMLGNVYEWVGDWYGYKYSAATQTDPVARTEGSSHNRVARGGSWYDGVPKVVRVSFRGGAAPEKRSNYIGFRCAGESLP
jgi:formylglycine-generating enzyme required for sulfatase activity